MDEVNKEIKGDGYRAEFKKAEFLAAEKTLSNEVLKFLIEESAEVRANPEVLKNMINEKTIEKYVEAFNNKRKDSNDYKEAVNFLRELF